MRLPEVLNIEPNGTDKTRLRLRIPEQLRYFPGHFPGFPILPGVVQIDWAIHYGRDLLGINGEFAGMENIKFLAILQPHDHVFLDLNWLGTKLDFLYSNHEKRYSNGRIIFMETA